MRSPSLFLYWKVCYIYFLLRGDHYTALELYLCLYWCICSSYNVICIDILVYFIQFNCWLYLILGIFSYIYPIYGLFFHCIIITFKIVLICFWMLYLCLLLYVGVLHTLLSLVVINIGKLLIHISCIWFFIQLSPSSLTWIHKSWLTSLFFN